MKSRIIALVLSLCSLAAFSQDSQKKDPFIGLEKKAVIEEYGQPTRVEKNANGGETLIYTRAQQIQGTPGNGKELFVYDKTDVYTFILDKNEQVIGWKISSIPKGS